MKEIQLSIRFPRIVTFLYERIPYWLDIVHRIIEIYTMMWGGDNYLIIPFDIKDGKVHIDEIFLRIFKEYDPDIIWIYNPSMLDIELSDRKLFRNGCSKLQNEYLKHEIEISFEEIVKEVRGTKLYNFSSIKSKIGKLSFPLFHNISRTSRPNLTYRKSIDDINLSSIRWPYSRLLVKDEVFSNLLDSSKIENYIFHLHDKFLKTLMYSISGKLPIYNLNSVHETKSISPLFKSLRKNSKYVIFDSSKSKIKRKIKLSTFLQEFLLYIDNNYPIKKEEKLGITFNSYNSPLHLILGGGDLKSFLIYFNLLRLGFSALYFPVHFPITSRIYRNYKEYTLNEQYRICVLKGILGANLKEILLVSSIRNAELYISKLLKKYAKRDLFLHLNINRFKEIKFKSLELDEVFNKQALENINEKERLISVNDFLTKGLNKKFYLNFYTIEAALSHIPVISHSEVLIELSIKDLPLLQMESFLEKLFIEDFKYYFHYSRVNKKGNLVLWLNTFLPVGQIPFLREEIFRENYFKYFFSSDLKTSDKGLLSKLMFENAKSPPKDLLEQIFISKYGWIIPLFLIKAKGKKLKHYQVYFPKGKLDILKNIDLGLVAKENEKSIFTPKDLELLNFFFMRQYNPSILKDIKNLYSILIPPQDPKLRSYINFLLENNIIEEGFFLRCKHCGQSWFYTYDKFNEEAEFKCIYCKRGQKLTLANHKFYTPLVFLSLKDYVYKLFDQNSDLVLMTLLWIFRTYNPRNFVWSEEMKLTNKFEVDLLAVSDGKLILSECKKSEDDFKQLIKKEGFLKFKETIKIN